MEVAPYRVSSAATQGLAASAQHRGRGGMPMQPMQAMQAMQARPPAADHAGQAASQAACCRPPQGALEVGVQSAPLPRR